MAVSKELFVIVLVYGLYGINHCTHAEEAQSFADMKKVIDILLNNVNQLKIANGKTDYENRQLRLKMHVVEFKQNRIFNELHEVRRINRQLYKEVKKLTFANRTAIPEVQSYSSDYNVTSKYQQTQGKEEIIRIYQTDKHQKGSPPISEKENYTGRKGIRKTGGMDNADIVSKRLLLNSPSTNIVAFSAILDHTVTLGPLQVVKYNKILTNIGNTYDPHHGHAIVRTKGIYLVSVTGMNDGAKAVNLELVRNDDLIGSLFNR
ncbi:Hypothetical predicted protein [Mytilus galloprovincialis]|uniref:C1q domain-containing protein n=1 Tax=Mytilus galloprovincialis TaxID=29158 RepID=A0A8B6DKW9_MYTGA|nr:Hypothetical predicted protein [Mytilus galloprovincialis]